MTVNPNDKLQELKSTVEELGYSVEHLPKSVDVPIELLSVSIEDDGQARSRILTISIYPLGDELDGSEFVQFFFQYPLEISNEYLPQILKKMSDANRELPLGHFNIDTEQTSLYFKYVLALPVAKEVNSLLINDVLDMCIYAYEYGEQITNQ